MFKTVAALEPGPKVGSKRGRSSRDKTKNKMTKRMKHLYNVKRLLTKIINKAVEQEELETLDATRVILREVETNGHILSLKAFAYRVDLSSEGPYLGRENFLSALQKVLSVKGYLADSGAFLKRDLPPPSLLIVVIHLDITSEVQLSPSLRMNRITVSEAVYDKVERFLNPFFKSSVHRHVQEFHIHADIRHLLPRQHSFVNAEGEILPGNSVRVDECEEEGERCVRMRQTWTPLKVTLSSLLYNPRKFNFVKYLHDVLAAKATVLMWHVLGRMKQERTFGLGAIEGRSECKVFLHGTAIAITTDARKCSLAELTFLCMDNGVLHSKKTGDGASTPSVFDDGTEIDSYGTECCWKVTEMGFERYPSGDSAHGELQARIVHSIREVTCKRFSNANRSHMGYRILGRAFQPESPLVAVVSNLDRDLNIVYQLNESVVDVKALIRAIAAERIRMEYVILLYAFSGWSLTASMHHIPQELFVHGFSSLTLRCIVPRFYHLHGGGVTVNVV